MIDRSVNYLGNFGKENGEKFKEVFLELISMLLNNNRILTN